MAHAFEVTGEIPAPCEDVYLAWLSSELHTAMTGGEAVVDPVVGGRFSAWGDYIVRRRVFSRPSRPRRSGRPRTGRAAASGCSSIRARTGRTRGGAATSA